MQSTAYDLNMYRPEEPKLREVKSSNKESNSKRSVRKAKGDLLCMGTGNLLVVMKRSRNAPVIFAPGA